MPNHPAAIVPLILTALCMGGCLSGPPMTIRGIVVDQDGAPLPKAEVRYSVSRITFKAGRWMKYTPYKSVRVRSDGRFTIRAMDVRSIRVNADLLGYYGQNVTLHHTVADAYRESGEDYVIVLDRMRNPVFLDSRRGSIGAFEDGGGVVFTYEPKDRGISLTTRRTVETGFVAVDDLLDAGNMPESGIKVIVETDAETGKFKVFEAPPLARDGTMLQRPARLRLVAFGPDSGIVVYERDSILPKRPIERQMRHAPYDGYERELALSVEEHHANDGSSSPVYFHVKLNGYYGRAIVNLSILSVREEDGLRFVAVPILLVMQPDGTRNLEERPY